MVKMCGSACSISRRSGQAATRKFACVEMEEPLRASGLAHAARLWFWQRAANSEPQADHRGHRPPTILLVILSGAPRGGGGGVGEMAADGARACGRRAVEGSPRRRRTGQAVAGPWASAISVRQDRRQKKWEVLRLRAAHTPPRPVGILLTATARRSAQDDRIWKNAPSVPKVDNTLFFPSCRSSSFGTPLSAKPCFVGGSRRHTSPRALTKRSFADTGAPRAGAWERGNSSFFCRESRFFSSAAAFSDLENEAADLETFFSGVRPAFPVLRSLSPVWKSTLPVLQSALSVLQSALSVLQSALSGLQSAFPVLQSTFPVWKT